MTIFTSVFEKLLSSLRSFCIGRDDNIILDTFDKSK